ncbi:hypothetical protein C8R47DRAFT_1213620 [Mycena vitilis]|nr:hypothetical protein C8R47DRAFT_1213620 [Mycena vitilis]
MSVGIVVDPAGRYTVTGWSREELEAWDTHRREREERLAGEGQVRGTESIRPSSDPADRDDENYTRLIAPTNFRSRADATARALALARQRTEMVRVALTMARGPSDTSRRRRVLYNLVEAERALDPNGQRAPLPWMSGDEGVDVDEDGWRTIRAEPLTPEDLYVGVLRPADITTEERLHQVCGVCRQVKSHPVSYECGHSHCYVCIRTWLEHNWTCPDCVGTIHVEPIRHWGEENGIIFDFPARDDGTIVSYSWEGLTFPRKPVSAAH